MPLPPAHQSFFEASRNLKMKNKALLDLDKPRSDLFVLHLTLGQSLDVHFSCDPAFPNTSTVLNRIMFLRCTLQIHSEIRFNRFRRFIFIFFTSEIRLNRFRRRRSSRFRNFRRRWSRFRRFRSFMTFPYIMVEERSKLVLRNNTIAICIVLIESRNGIFQCFLQVYHCLDTSLVLFDPYLITYIKFLQEFVEKKRAITIRVKLCEVAMFLTGESANIFLGNC